MATAAHPKTIASNIAFLLFSRILERVIIAVVTIIVARHFGVGTFGEYSTALAFATLFFVFADLGMSTLLLREGSKEKSVLSVYFGNTLISELAMSALLYVLMLGSGLLLRFNETVITLLLWLGATQFLMSMQLPLQTIYQIFFKTYVTSLFQIINSVLVITIALIVAHLELSVTYFAASQFLISFVLTTIFFAITARLVRPRVIVSRLLPMLRVAYLFGLSSIFYFIFFQIDAVMLSVIKGSEQVGLYTAAYKLIIAVFIVPSVIGYVMYPLMFELFKSNQERLKNIFFSLYKYLSSIGLLFAVVLFFLANEIIQLLYGHEFLDSALALQILAWAICVRFLSVAPSQLLTSIDRQKIKTKIMGFAALLNIFLNLFMIPALGFRGAALSSLLSEAFVLIVFVMLIWRFVGRSLLVYVQKVVPSLIAAIIATITILLLKPHFHVIIIAVVTLVVYAGVLFAVKFFGPEDKKLLTQILSKT